MIGHGDAFVIRDPAGIRPAFYYKDDEILMVTFRTSANSNRFERAVRKNQGNTSGSCFNYAQKR